MELLNPSILLMTVLGASSKYLMDECHHWKDKGKSPSAASQVILVRLPALRSSLNWNGTILGGISVLSLECLCVLQNPKITKTR